MRVQMQRTGALAVFIEVVVVVASDRVDYGLRWRLVLKSGSFGSCNATPLHKHPTSTRKLSAVNVTLVCDLINRANRSLVQV